jgi:hypothetical protein
VKQIFDSTVLGKFPTLTFIILMVPFQKSLQKDSPVDFIEILKSASDSEKPNTRMVPT